MVKIKDVIDIILNNGLYIAYDNGSNFGDVYIDEYLSYIINDLGFKNYTFENLIEDIEKDERVERVAGCSDEGVLDIIFTDDAIQDYVKRG